MVNWTSLGAGVPGCGAIPCLSIWPECPLFSSLEKSLDCIGFVARPIAQESPR